MLSSYRLQNKWLFSQIKVILELEIFKLQGQSSKASFSSRFDTLQKERFLTFTFTKKINLSSKTTPEGPF